MLISSFWQLLYRSSWHANGDGVGGIAQDVCLPMDSGFFTEKIILPGSMSTPQQTVSSRRNLFQLPLQQKGAVCGGPKKLLWP